MLRAVEPISQDTQGSFAACRPSISHSPRPTSLMPPFLSYKKQEQEALSESSWGDHHFQNVPGKFRMGLLQANHEISRHFTKTGVCTRSTSDHPTQTVPTQKGMSYHEAQVCKFKGRKSKIILVGMTKIILMNGALIWLRSCRSPLGHMRFSVHNGRVSTFFLTQR